MVIPTYRTGFPQDGSSLGSTKAQIRANLDGTFETLSVDHINNNGAPGTNPAGYHNVIHIVPQGSNPSPVAGFGQLFSKIINDVTNDTALFWETGGGLVSQLTTNLAPVVSTNGYSYLPGGLIFQWGRFNPNSSTNVSFPLTFPNNVFNIQLTGSADNNSTFRNGVSTGTLTTSGFSWEGTISSHWNPIYWLAIGN